MSNGLTDKQKMFCKEYLVDLNATQAAIRAGYSEHTAHAIGAENLTKPLIKEQIQREMDDRAVETKLTANYVLNNIIKIGERCVKLDKDSGALRAQELLGKHMKLFNDDASKLPAVTVVMPSITVNGEPKEYNVGSPKDS